MNRNRIIPLVIAAAGVLLAAVAIAGISQSQWFGNFGRGKTYPLAKTGADDAEPAYSRAGKPAPDFELTSLDGTPVHLSEFKGHPILINYWATWCPPCREELPLIQDRLDRYGPDLVILTINAGEDLETVKNYLNRNEFSFHVLLDPDWKAEALYGVMAYPTSIFIDREGVIQARYVGGISASILDEYLGLIGVSE